MNGTLTLVPGTPFGAYRLMRRVGKGGMGEVWVVQREGNTSVRYAMKLILAQHGRDTDVFQMMLDEIRILQLIKHRNVCAFVDAGLLGGVPFFVMEWVEGESLLVWLQQMEAQKRNLPVPIAARILHDAAMGLHAAHELRDQNGALLNVVHRDITPHNILVEQNGRVCVIDFGIAKSEDRNAENTVVGIVRGKTRYVAPEQELGRSDRRADVWGLGATLYCALSGEPPYAGRDDVQILSARLRGESYARNTEKLPPTYLSVLKQCWAESPDDRFPTAEAFAKTLKAAGPMATEEQVAAFARSLVGTNVNKVSRDLAGAQLLMGAVVSNASAPVERLSFGKRIPNISAMEDADIGDGDEATRMMDSSSKRLPSLVAEEDLGSEGKTEVSASLFESNGSEDAVSPSSKSGRPKLALSPAPTRPGAPPPAWNPVTAPPPRIQEQDPKMALGLAATVPAMQPLAQSGKTKQLQPPTSPSAFRPQGGAAEKPSRTWLYVILALVLFAGIGFGIALLILRMRGMGVGLE